MFLRSLLLLFLGLAALRPAVAEDTARLHAIAMHGAPKYAADFQRLDDVNPSAPKGGEMRLATQGTFDSIRGG